LSLKYGDLFARHSGQAGDGQREPESIEFEESWIPAFAAMTVREASK
jgi:hypothetical protein